jgi:AraC-like DNA-binding protein
MGKHVAFQAWHHRVEGAEVSPVFPDGCRDVLIIAAAGAPDRVVLTEFDVCPRYVSLPAGTKIAGYRLRPGAAVDRLVLEAIAKNRAAVDDILFNAVRAADETDEAILALTLPGATLGTVSRSLGVSVRTMQRRFRELGLPPPDYWRLLARARRAVALLASTVPLAEIAGDSGYSDQAHMTREFVRWFGQTPSRVRQDAGLLDLLRQPALGNWTGEQSSTR